MFIQLRKCKHKSCHSKIDQKNKVFIQVEPIKYSTRVPGWPDESTEPINAGQQMPKVPRHPHPVQRMSFASPLVR